MVNGPEVVKVLTFETSAEAAAVPSSLSLHVSLPRFGSGSSAVAVALLSKAPAALMVAVTLIVVLEPEASDGIVHGRAEQPEPLTFVMVRWVGVSVTWIDVAVEGPPLAMTSV